MSGITIACATRLSDKEFFERSALGRSLAAYRGYPLKLNLFQQNTRGLGECYNHAIDSTRDEDDILLFIHDDVLIADFFWMDRLHDGLARFALAGVAGTTRRLPRQPSWGFLDDRLTREDPKYLSGIVGHGWGVPCDISHFGPAPQACKLLDGLCLAARKKTFTEHGIRFDERFQFHFYDMDLCRQFEAKGLDIGTMPLSLIHESPGNFTSASWKTACQAYLEKWGE